MCSWCVCLGRTFEFHCTLPRLLYRVWSVLPLRKAPEFAQAKIARVFGTMDATIGMSVLITDILKLYALL